MMENVFRIFHNGIHCPVKECTEIIAEGKHYFDLEIDIPQESLVVDASKVQNLDEEDDRK